MIGIKLKELREYNKLSQKDVANLIFVSDKTISSWENDRTLPDIFTLEKLCKIYNVSIEDIIEGEPVKVSSFNKQVRMINTFTKKNILNIIIFFSALIIFVTTNIVSAKSSFLVLVISMIIISFSMIIFDKLNIFYFLILIPYLFENISIVLFPYFHTTIYLDNEVIRIFLIIIFTTVLLLSFIMALIKLLKDKNKSSTFRVLMLPLWLISVAIINHNFIFGITGNKKNEMKVYIDKVQEFPFLVMIQIILVCMVIFVNKYLFKKDK